MSWKAHGDKHHPTGPHFLQTQKFPQHTSFQIAGLHENLSFPSSLIMLSCGTAQRDISSWLHRSTAGQMRPVPSDHRAILQTSEELMCLQSWLLNTTASHPLKGLRGCSWARPRVQAAHHSQPRLQTEAQQLDVPKTNRTEC